MVYLYHCLNYVNLQIKKYNSINICNKPIGYLMKTRMSSKFVLKSVCKASGSLSSCPQGKTIYYKSSTICEMHKVFSFIGHCLQ